MILLNAHFHSQFAVTFKHSVFTVNGQKIFRFNKAEHDLQFFLTAVSGNMNPLILTEHDIGAETHEIIDCTPYTRFIAGYRRCRDNNRIAGHNTDAAMIVRRHPGQACHRFPLTARRQNKDLIGRVAVQFVRFNKYAFRHFQIA